MAEARERARRRARRHRLVRRWLAVAALALVAVLYYRPVRTYFETRAMVAERAREVAVLRRERQALERRLALETSDAALLREARRLGHVKPGERLFIVKGIAAWRRAHARSERAPRPR